MMISFSRTAVGYCVCVLGRGRQGWEGGSVRREVLEDKFCVMGLYHVMQQK